MTTKVFFLSSHSRTFPVREQRVNLVHVTLMFNITVCLIVNDDNTLFPEPQQWIRITTFNSERLTLVYVSLMLNIKDVQAFILSSFFRAWRDQRIISVHVALMLNITVCLIVNVDNNLSPEPQLVLIAPIRKDNVSIVNCLLKNSKLARAEIVSRLKMQRIILNRFECVYIYVGKCSNYPPIYKIVPPPHHGKRGRTSG